MSKENYITKLPARSVSLIETSLNKKLFYFGSADTLAELVKLDLAENQNIITPKTMESKDYIEILRHSLESQGLQLLKTEQRLVSARLHLDQRLFVDPTYERYTLMHDYSGTRSVKYVSSEALPFLQDIAVTDVKPLNGSINRVFDLFEINTDSLVQSTLITQIPTSQPVAQPTATQDGPLTKEQRLSNANASAEKVIAEALKVRDSQPIYQMSQRNKDNDLEMLETTEYKGGQGHFPIINYDDSFNAFDNDDARLTHFDMFCNPKEL